MNPPVEAATYVEAPEPEVAARRSATRLRNLLRINSVFSVMTGLIGLIAGGPVAGFLGVDQVWLIRLLGAGLLVFAAIVFLVSGTRTSTLGSLSRIISLNDFGWVLGTIVVITLGWLSTAGAIVMGLIGVIVLELGISQMRARGGMIKAAAVATADPEESPPVDS